MKKRLLSGVLCLSMILAMTACGAQTESQSAETSKASSSAAVSATAATATAAEAGSAETGSAEESVSEAAPGTAPAAEFPNSDTADLKFSNEYTLPLCEDTETLTMMHSSLNLVGPLANAGISDFSQVEYLKELESRTNVQLDITELTYATMQEQYQLAVAANDLTDLLCGFSYAKGDESALSDGIILDLTDLLSEKSPNYDYMIHSSDKHENEFLSDGKVLKYISPYEQYVANQGLVVRSDWLEQVGMDAPQTYDQLTDTLKAFKSTFGAETAIYMNSECAITSLADGYDICSFAADGGNDTSMPYYVDGGTVKCTLNSDGYRDYLKMLNSWYTDGLMDKDFYSIAYNPFDSYLSDQITSDQMGVWCTSGEGIDTYTVPISCLASMTKTEDGMDHIFDTSLTSDSFNDTYISADSDNADLAMAWMDYWYSADGVLFANYGVEGTDYTIGDNGQPEFSDAVVNNQYDVTVSNMMRLECGYGVFSAPMLRYRTAEFNSDLANEAWDTWSSKLDGSMTMPSYVTLSSDENDTESSHSSDLLTYVEQTIPQFIIGDKSLDDDWDAYVQNLDNMGLSDCIDAWQQAYDRTAE